MTFRYSEAGKVFYETLRKIGQIHGKRYNRKSLEGQTAEAMMLKYIITRHFENEGANYKIIADELGYKTTQAVGKIKKHYGSRGKYSTYQRKIADITLEELNKERVYRNK